MASKTSMGKGKILISKSPSGASATAAHDPNSVTKKKKKKSSSSETYTSYIFKVLRQVRPNVKITRRAMSIMNSFVSDTFERIANEAAVLCTYSKKETLSSNEVGTAVRLVLPGDLAKYAVIEGVNAVQTYTKDQTTKRPRTATTTTTSSTSTSAAGSSSNKSATATPSSSGAAGATAGG